MNLDKFIEQPMFSSFINGNFIKGHEQAKEDFISLTTGKKWKSFIPVQPEDSKQAIAAAKNASMQWKMIPPPIRGAYIRKIGDALLANKEVLAHLMAMEMGKPIKEGANEVDYAAGFYYWFSGEAERIYGLTIPSQHPRKRLMVSFQPIGVCGVITPWNFPLAMGARKIAAALAAGCTVVCKPSPECPFSTLLLGKIAQEINLPPGVINILIGPEKEIGEALLASVDVRKMTFTGSCEVGRYLYRGSAETLKKITLELGGHAPLLVFDDADLEKAVEGTITAKFRNNGQTCVAPNRILLQEKIFESYKKKLIESTKKLCVGNPLDSKTDLSTVLHPASIEKVQEHVKDALDKGATADLKGEFSYQPTILSEVNSSMKVFHEETFGPVLPLISFKTLEEAISIANDSLYGLAAYAFTQNLKQAHIVAECLEYGIIGLNDGLPSTPQGSFGGVKYSGFGREGGPSGIREYLVEKYISVGL